MVTVSIVKVSDENCKNARSQKNPKITATPMKKYLK